MDNKGLILKYTGGFVIFFILLLTNSPNLLAAGSTITVDTTVDDTTINGNCTLREAIIAANTDINVDNCPAGNGTDIISLSAGTYILTIPGTGENAAATGDLDIGQDVKIVGIDSASTLIDGNGIDRVFEVFPGVTAEISSVTIRRGAGGFEAGGIVNRGNLTLSESILSENIGSVGGGIRNFGDLIVYKSTISKNISPGGFGGAGIRNSGGTVLLNSSTIRENDTGGQGGGIRNRGQMTIIDSTINGNKAQSGGGMYAFFGGTTTVFINSTISGNVATGFFGGGILNAAMLELVNSTITENSAARIGGGIWNGDTAILRNTIVAGNNAGIGPDCDGFNDITLSLGFNLVGDLSDCSLSPTASDLINVNPLLGPLQNNGGSTETHALLQDSPALDVIPTEACIDTGGNPVATDQRGIKRPQKSACDIGAFELEVPLVNVDIDIKPGSYPNCFNNNGNGVIPVAILSNPEFDATQVDSATVELDGQSIQIVGKKDNVLSHIEDSNGDGLDDLVVQIEDEDGTYEVGDTIATLTGYTFDGIQIEGTDSLCIVP